MKRTQRFSIRKSTLGVASVLVGVFAVGVTTATAGTIIPMINGVEQPQDKVENVPDDVALTEQAANEVIAKYKQNNYKPAEGSRVEGDKLYLNFTNSSS